MLIRRASFQYFALNPCGRYRRVLVLPYPNDDPARFGEGGICRAIALDVSFELRSPPLLIVARPGLVNGAYVPEAPVDEDRNLGTSEHDVRTNTRVREWPMIDAKPQAAAVEF